MDAATAYAQRDTAFLLDVRQPGEWDVGRIAEAVLLPMGELAARQDELPNDRPIIVVCRSGSRSAMVTRALQQAGYDVANLDGGMQVWAREGFPVVADGGAPGAVA